jgi:hypothetical protein
MARWEKTSKVREEFTQEPGLPMRIPRPRKGPGGTKRRVEEAAGLKSDMRLSRPTDTHRRTYFCALCSAYNWGKRSPEQPVCERYSVSSTVRRYIEEEFRDTEEQPVYLPGDRICLRLRTAHEVNLGSVWAIFRRVVVPEGGGKAIGGPYITLVGKHYPLSRAEAVRASEVYFETEVSRDLHPPGEYRLQAVRAYPYDLDGREDSVMEFELRGEILFRIAEEYDTPSPRVTGWKFD